MISVSKKNKCHFGLFKNRIKFIAGGITIRKWMIYYLFRTSKSLREKLAYLYYLKMSNSKSSDIQTRFSKSQEKTVRSMKSCRWFVRLQYRNWSKPGTLSWLLSLRCVYSLNKTFTRTSGPNLIIQAQNHKRGAPRNQFTFYSIFVFFLSHKPCPRD